MKRLKETQALLLIVGRNTFEQLSSENPSSTDAAYAGRAAPWRVFTCNS